MYLLPLYEPTGDIKISDILTAWFIMYTKVGATVEKVTAIIQFKALIEVYKFEIRALRNIRTCTCIDRIKDKTAPIACGCGFESRSRHTKEILKLVPAAPLLGVQ